MPRTAQSTGPELAPFRPVTVALGLSVAVASCRRKDPSAWSS